MNRRESPSPFRRGGCGNYVREVYEGKWDFLHSYGLLFLSEDSSGLLHWSFSWGHGDIMCKLAFHLGFSTLGMGESSKSDGNMMENICQFGGNM